MSTTTRILHESETTDVMCRWERFDPHPLATMAAAIIAVQSILADDIPRRWLPQDQPIAVEVRRQQRDCTLFLRSKGQACSALHAALALNGFFPVEDLSGLRKIDYNLEGNPHVFIPGVDTPSGSHGTSLSRGLRMALGPPSIIFDTL